MIRRTLLSAITALALLTPAANAAPLGHITVMNGSGGNVLQTLQKRAEYQASGKQVRIRGYCRSACTLFLSLPNACIGRKARVGFHAPRFPGTKIITPIVGDIMAQYYVPAVRQRWLSSWQYSLDMKILSAAQYRKLDPRINYCP